MAQSLREPPRESPLVPLRQEGERLGEREIPLLRHERVGARPLLATGIKLPNNIEPKCPPYCSQVSIRTTVVGYAPGGSKDINARELARLMSPILGQQIVVDNKGGANCSLGLHAVAAARLDGYTQSYTSAQTIVVNPWVQKGMIDTLTTLLPICQTTDY